jgi:UDP-N-acetylmuramoyl-L-alanyl-D-glutamate--2,6-diaminopimelate ligase
MQLSELIDVPDTAGALAIREVAGLCADSRKVKAGDVFFALAGAKEDGLAFVAQAVDKGASVIVAERAPSSLPPDVGVLVVADARAALAHAAARLYPGQPATIVAVTGTSGKTSVAAFARQIWMRLGEEAASLGTIGIVSRLLNVYGSLTTPDPIALHRALDELARAGVTHLALEASSHGLDQKRLEGVRLAAAAFTNLSRDLRSLSCRETALVHGAPVARRAGGDRRRQRCRRDGRRCGQGARPQDPYDRRQGRIDPSAVGLARGLCDPPRPRTFGAPMARAAAAAG